MVLFEKRFRRISIPSYFAIVGRSANYSEPSGVAKHSKSDQKHEQHAAVRRTKIYPAFAAVLRLATEESAASLKIASTNPFNYGSDNNSLSLRMTR